MTLNSKFEKHHYGPRKKPWKKEKALYFSMALRDLTAFLSRASILPCVPQIMSPALEKPNLYPQENGYLWKSCLLYFAITFQATLWVGLASSKCHRWGMTSHLRSHSWCGQSHSSRPSLSDSKTCSLSTALCYFNQILFFKGFLKVPLPQKTFKNKNNQSLACQFSHCIVVICSLN